MEPTPVRGNGLVSPTEEIAMETARTHATLAASFADQG